MKPHRLVQVMMEPAEIIQKKSDFQDPLYVLSWRLFLLFHYFADWQVTNQTSKSTIRKEDDLLSGTRQI